MRFYTKYITKPYSLIFVNCFCTVATFFYAYLISFPYTFDFCLKKRSFSPKSSVVNYGHGPKRTGSKLGADFW